MKRFNFNLDGIVFCLTGIFVDKPETVNVNEPNQRTVMVRDFDMYDCRVNRKLMPHVSDIVALDLMLHFIEVFCKDGIDMEELEAAYNTKP